MQNDEADFPKIISSLLIIVKIGNHQSSSSEMGFYELLLKINKGKGYSLPSLCFNVEPTKILCLLTK